MTRYMVEMDVSDRQREREWNAWYATHVMKLLRMPGFRGAQRFMAERPTVSPYLAVCEIDSPDVLISPAYRSGGGPRSPGNWIAIMVDWHRNLFDAQVAPAVPLDRFRQGCPVDHHLSLE